jgi:hypothetical protein
MMQLQLFVTSTMCVESVPLMKCTLKLCIRGVRVVVLFLGLHKLFNLLSDKFIISSK